MTHCTACGAPRAGRSATPAGADVLAATEAVLAVLRRGWGRTGLSPVRSGVYFAALRVIVGRLAREVRDVDAPTAPPDGWPAVHGGTPPRDAGSYVRSAEPDFDGARGWWPRQAPEQRAPLIAAAHAVLTRVDVSASDVGAPAWEADVAAALDASRGHPSPRRALGVGDGVTRRVTYTDLVSTAVAAEMSRWGTGSADLAGDPAQIALPLRPSDRWQRALTQAAVLDAQPRCGSAGDRTSDAPAHGPHGADLLSAAHDARVCAAAEVERRARHLRGALAEPA